MSRVAAVDVGRVVVNVCAFRDKGRVWKGTTGAWCSGFKLIRCSWCYNVLGMEDILSRQIFPYTDK